MKTKIMETVYIVVASFGEEETYTSNIKVFKNECDALIYANKYHRVMLAKSVWVSECTGHVLENTYDYESDAEADFRFRIFSKASPQTAEYFEVEIQEFTTQ